jgi:hypothetical protein
MHRLVKDIMIPLSEYATVAESASVLAAFEALEESQRRLSTGRQPHRGVLAVDDAGRIVGKIGQLTFLRALEPRYSLLGDLQQLSNVGLSPEFIDSMMEQHRFWQDDFIDLQARARNTTVREVMIPIELHLEESDTLSEAIHHMVVSQTLSLLVTSNGHVTGILRLSDLFEEVSKMLLPQK